MSNYHAVKYVSLLLLLLCPSLGAKEEFRKWTSKQGTIIEAILMRTTPPKGTSFHHHKGTPRHTVHLKQRNGKVIEVDLYQLSQDDRKYISEFEKQSRITDDSPIQLHLSSMKKEEGYKHRNSILKFTPFNRQELYPISPEWAAKRETIPNYGSYEDSKNESALVLANHLLWFGAAQKSAFKIENNPDREWKRVLRLTDREVRTRGHHPSLPMIAPQEIRQAFIEAEVPIRAIKTFSNLRPDLEPLMAVSQGANLVVLSCQAERDSKEGFVYCINVVDIEGDELTITYRDDRTAAKLEFVDSDDDRKRGYWLRFKLADPSYLATSLREERMELFVEYATAYSFQFK